jgi:hypothetical protein
MSWLEVLLSRLYRFLIRFYPPAYREEFGAEQAQVFDQVMEDAAQHNGRWSLYQALLELRELPGCVLRVRLQRRDRLMLGQFFPKTSDKTPWGVALLSLAPLFIMGPLMAILGYFPAWREMAASPAATRFLAVFLGLILTLGLVIGAVKKFPRWSYPYGVFGLLMLTFILYYFIEEKSWEPIRQPYLLLILIAGVFLLTRLVPFLRPFQSNLRQDWTLLSYGLCSCTIIFVSLHDQDVVPHLNWMVPLPSLVCLAGMLAHLRLASSVQRFEALLASALLAVLLWLLPVFSGGSMLGFPGGMYFARFLLASWGIVLVLICSPMLIGIYNRLVDRSRPGASSLSASSK